MDVNTVQATPRGSLASVAAYKRAMRKLAGGVCVVTSIHDGKKAGLTATAVCSLSVAPPSMVVCIDQESRTHAFIKGSGRLAVNALAVDQIQIAQRFSGATGLRGEDKFRGIGWSLGATGVPVLEDAMAAFECVVSTMIPSGSHSIIVALIANITTNNTGQSLVYVEGAYAAVAQLE